MASLKFGLARESFDNFDVIMTLWEDLFAKGLEQIWDPNRFSLECVDPQRSDLLEMMNFLDSKPPAAGSACLINPICKIVDRTRERLNEARGLDPNDRDHRDQGHATLFVREPLSDRLILVYSTSSNLNPGCSVKQVEKHLTDPEANYDLDSQRIFYDLHDRLSKDNEKSDGSARKARGITGWVAVSGHPLRINRERDNAFLQDVKLESAALNAICEEFGDPEWGSRVSEFRGTDSKDWHARLLAVPIRSVTSEDKVIGVLRYTCERATTKALRREDLSFLESMGSLISMVLNLGRIRVLAERRALIDQRIAKFEETGDFGPLLRFMARAFRSKIASLYLLVNINGIDVLRLVDAFGIADDVSELPRIEAGSESNEDSGTGNASARYRPGIRDYTPQNTGLTWRLARQADLRGSPTCFDSVVDVNGWRGINTQIFYRHHLSKYTGDEKAILKNYTIKLMGSALEHQDKVVGVLKVEFPNTFDADLHYEQDDKDFFDLFRKPLSEELKGYQDFINGPWFTSVHQDPAEFVRYLFQIIRLRLVAANEAPEFWRSVRNYETQNLEEVRRHGMKYAQASLSSAQATYLAELEEKESLPDVSVAIIFRRALEALADELRQGVRITLREQVRSTILEIIRRLSSLEYFS